ncbi:MAG: flavin reductase family protein [Aureispira sp.]|nr:flavin reductase family protein [Aureispira sp.]
MSMRVVNPGEIPTKDLHQFIVGAIAPRPIAFVSTIDENGIPNIAPYSFFNAFSSNPPVLVFSSNRTVAGNNTKDTLHNVQLNQEVVVNVVNYEIVRQMTIASVSYPPEVSEFDKSGLTPVESDLVKPYRIKESPVHFECKVKEIITLGEHGGAGHLVICDVLRLHIDENVLDGERINPHKLDLVGRLGRANYVRASGDAIFSVYQSVMDLALGFDKLPKSIQESSFLTGNEIAQLAGQYVLPTTEEIQAVKESNSHIKDVLNNLETEPQKCVEELHKYAKQLLAKEEAKTAFDVLMLADEIG